MQEFIENDSYELQKSELTNGCLIFENLDGFERAIKDGFFFIKQPNNISLHYGDLFAKNFYLPKKSDNAKINHYRGFFSYTKKELEEHEGYYQRDKDQTEQFFLERKFWKNIFPKELNDTAEYLKDFSICILRNVLFNIGLPTDIWEKATGGCSHGKGTYHLTFNHFRTYKDVRGLNTHKDSGWVTVLRSIDPGLEAFIENNWVKINPLDGYFIVNFGCALEILTRNLDKPVSAIIHRVIKQNKKDDKQVDRFSYALFTDNSLNQNYCLGLYEYSKNRKLELLYNFKSFLDEILLKTYQDDNVGLY
jgi:isopenicillin N synthase-like dioxygenase